MKWRWAFYGSMSTAALLLPYAAVPESRIQAATAGTQSSAAAHVNFKVVIPPVLYLHVGSEYDRTAGAKSVTIMSNGRNVTLNATAVADDTATVAATAPAATTATAATAPAATTATAPAATTATATASTAAADSRARSNTLLRTSAGKLIAQDAQCTPTPADAVSVSAARARTNADPRHYICTASTP